jgi:PII-like signaling protein
MYLLERAARAGIQHALLYRVQAGFLCASEVSADRSDAPPRALPQCIELVGEHAILQTFLAAEEAYLKDAAIITFSVMGTKAGAPEASSEVAV